MPCKFCKKYADPTYSKPMPVSFGRIYRHCPLCGDEMVLSSSEMHKKMWAALGKKAIFFDGPKHVQSRIKVIASFEEVLNSKVIPSALVINTKIGRETAAP